MSVESTNWRITLRSLRGEEVLPKRGAQEGLVCKLIIMPRLPMTKKELKVCDIMPKSLFKNQKVKDFPLSNRVKNSLQQYAIAHRIKWEDFTGKQFLNMSERDLLNLPGIGEGSLGEVTDYMRRYGVHFKDLKEDREDLEDQTPYL
jgi:DNA-directed RNA polymerase alpha subunit